MTAMMLGFVVDDIKVTVKRVQSGWNCFNTREFVIRSFRNKTCRRVCTLDDGEYMLKMFDGIKGFVGARMTLCS